MPLTKQKLADRIVELVNRQGDATHGTMICHLGDAVRGKEAIYVDAANICIAVGASRVLADAIEVLMTEQPRRVAFDVAHPLVALCDGIPMPSRMAWAKRPPRNGSYRHPHFAPIRLERVTA